MKLMRKKNRKKIRRNEGEMQTFVEGGGGASYLDSV